MHRFTSPSLVRLFIRVAPVSLVGASAVTACLVDTDDPCELRATCPEDAGADAPGSDGSNTTSGAGGAATGMSGASSTTAAGGMLAAGGMDAGTAGGAAGGGGAPEPCNGECSGSTPVCDEAEDECVECLDSDDCDGATPACDETAHACVECIEHDDCDNAGAPWCDTGDNVCVECLETDDCDEPSTSRCDGGACVACEDNDDCAHIAGAGVCDGGMCVECTVQDETPCGANSCDPATNECTETERGSAGTCKPCLADSECIGGNQTDPDTRCVPMEFMGVPRVGGFCLKRLAKTCSPPYSIIIAAASLSGAPEEDYCGINQEATRCEAVVDLVAGRTCADDEDCGCARDDEGNCLETGQGGLCRMVGALANRCTYPCGDTAQCPTPRTCVDQPYCH